MITSEGTRAFRPYSLTIPAIAAVGAFVGLLGWAVEHTTYDTWGGLVVSLVVVLVSVPVVIRLARREEDRRVARLLPWALGLKLAASLARLAVTFGVYDGVADASTYHTAGELLAPMYRRGDFSGDVGGLIGTGFVKSLTGAVYAVTGATRLGGFMIFSLMGFWGLYLFYRAFCLACPEGDHWRYARLVFLLPSLLFWPSSIGKEAWMTLTLGLAAYGAARIVARHRGGFAVLAVGLTGTVMVRPHVSAILMVSLVAAYLLRRPPSGTSLLSPVAKLVGILVLGLALVLVVGQTKKLFGVKDRFDAEAVGQVLQRANSQTSGGGSGFSTSSTDLSPSKFPSALVAVLFRPFPWEARNPLALVASLEGTVLLGAFVVGRRRVLGAIRSVLRTPYVVLCLSYSVLFVYAFSSFANFGVLTRQRVQVFPFLLVLLALPAYRPSGGGWRDLLVQPYEEPDEEPDAVEPAPVPASRP